MKGEKDVILEAISDVVGKYLDEYFSQLDTCKVSFKKHRCRSFQR